MAERDGDRYFVHDLIDMNLDDLQREVDRLRKNEGRLVGIGDEENGIIGYAISGQKTDGFGDLIVKALNKRQAAPCIKREFLGGSQTISFDEFANEVIQDYDQAEEIGRTLIGDVNSMGEYAYGDGEYREQFTLLDARLLAEQMGTIPKPKEEG